MERDPPQLQPGVLDDLLDLRAAVDRAQRGEAWRGPAGASSRSGYASSGFVAERTPSPRRRGLHLDLRTVHGDSSTSRWQTISTRNPRARHLSRAPPRAGDTRRSRRGPRMAPAEVRVPRSARGRHQPAPDDRLPVAVVAPTARAASSAWTRTSSCCSARPATSPGASCCPGMAHLVLSALSPDIRVVGTSLEDSTTSRSARSRRRRSRVLRHPPAQRGAVGRRSPPAHYVPQSAGPEALAAAVARRRGRARRRTSGGCTT